MSEKNKHDDDYDRIGVDLGRMAGEKPAPAKRAALLKIFATMPEEGFNWIIGAAVAGQIWPDVNALNGFQQEARESIVEFVRECERYGKP
jgi:hypothetical protein